MTGPCPRSSRQRRLEAVQGLRVRGRGWPGRFAPRHDVGLVWLRQLFAAAASQLAFALASWIARQTRSGVSGMSICVMPYSDSASITALTMQTRLPAQPASPQPLVPSGLDLGGRGMVADFHQRNVFGARHRVIHERAGDRLAAVVVADFLHQRLADALRDAAMQLAGDDHRVDDGAEIVDAGVAHDRGSRRSRDRSRLPRHGSHWGRSTAYPWWRGRRRAMSARPPASCPRAAAAPVP